MEGQFQGLINVYVRRKCSWLLHRQQPGEDREPGQGKQVEGVRVSFNCHTFLQEGEAPGGAKLVMSGLDFRVQVSCGPDYLGWHQPHPVFPHTLPSYLKECSDLLASPKACFAV